MEIRINDCKIESSQIGNNNEMIVNNTNNSITDKDWELLVRFFDEKIPLLESGSVYFILANEAKEYAVRKDQKGFKELMKRYGNEFAAKLLCNLTGKGILSILAKLGLTI